MRTYGKKLVLHAETVRTLNDPELEQINGGMIGTLLRANPERRERIRVAPSGPNTCGCQPFDGDLVADHRLPPP